MVIFLDSKRDVRVAFGPSVIGSESRRPRRLSRRGQLSATVKIYLAKNIKICLPSSLAATYRYPLLIHFLFMAGISVSGLISNSFNWQSIVDQLIQIDSAPIAKLNTDTADNNNRLASFASLKSGLTDLQTSANALAADGLFNGRIASSATPNSSWSSTAANSAATGSYAIAVTQLASAAQRTGASGISAGLSASSNVSGITLATMPTAIAPTAGTFTVNGATVTVALTDSLQDVFDKISAATGGIVTAAYDSATDKVSLTSSDNSEIVLGAGNDTSNLLSALRLANNGTGSLTSSSALGNASLNVPLVDARLVGSFGAVDGSGNGTFAINGVSIAYNINTDSLATVLSRISASSAGVSASYDGASNRVILTNNATGDVGIGASDTSGSLLAALGFTTGSTLVHGKNALFSVNGGATISSASNTLDAATLGVPGLSVTVSTKDTQTISVAGNVANMQNAIQDFVTKFNSLQDFITSQTEITKGAD